jgi:hypothetical protein
MIITLKFDPDLQKKLDALFDFIRKKENFETKVITCKGANSNCAEITAMITLEHEYPIVRCHRNPRSRMPQYEEGLCYCGNLSMKTLTFVQEPEYFARNNIFSCPYGRLK